MSNAEETLTSLHQQARQLPDQPGVYIFQDGRGEPLYVGKAKSLRKRVTSYFHQDTGRATKTRHMLQQVRGLDTLVADSETEALLLEANLIQTHQPPFNVRLRGDSGYPYVRMTTQEPFPRLEIVHQVEEGEGRYFGPYPRVGDLTRVVREVMRVYQIRSCSWDLPQQSPERPCLDYHIDRCQAPCVGWQSQEAYQQQIQKAMRVLRGQTRDFARQIEGEMEAHAEELNFERAQELKQVIETLDRMKPRPQVSDPRGGNRDVLGVSTHGQRGCVVLLQVRGGELQGRRYRFLEFPKESSPRDLLGTYVRSEYSHQSTFPPHLLTPLQLPDQALLREYLASQREDVFRISQPQRGHDRRLVDLASDNAEHLLEQEVHTASLKDDSARQPTSLYRGSKDEFEAGRALAEALDLPDSPRDLVGFDISTLQGVDSVGSAVWLREGQPHKERYRHFRMGEETSGQPDDYRMMAEVVKRFFRKRKDEPDQLPDLVVIDGGRGQLRAAQNSLREMGLEKLPVVGLAKQQEEIFRSDQNEPLALEASHPGLHWLQRVRDEAHRFALKYHHTLRERRTLRSQLGEIEGVGAHREQTLLQAFGSIEALREASKQEIEQVGGIGPQLADEIHKFLHVPPATEHANHDDATE